MPEQTEPGSGDGVTDPLDLGEVAAEAADALLVFAPRMSHLMRHRLQQVDPPLTYRQYRILGHIRDGATSLKALNQRTVISMSALSETIDGLFRKGLVTRMPSERDRRGIDLGLSDAGVDVLERATPVMRSLAAEVVSHVPVEDRASFLRAVEAMQDTVRDTLAAHHPS